MLSINHLAAVLDLVEFPGYRWIASEKDGRLFLHAHFDAPHCKTRLIEVQTTRKWYVSYEATRSEVVQTALKCVLTSVEHEAREQFKYRGEPIFGPHFEVDDLAKLCAEGRGDAGGRAVAEDC